MAAGQAANSSTGTGPQQAATYGTLSRAIWIATEQTAKTQYCQSSDR